MIIIENKKNEIFCKKCETYSNITFFLKNYRILKNCESCRIQLKLNKEAYKCEHNKFKYRCVECSPHLFCIHAKRRDICCKGKSLCSHEKQRHLCKLCNDEIHITIKCILASSKQKDIKYNRFNSNEFIDYPYVKSLIQNCDNSCYYCNVNLQFTYFNQTLGTIERLNPKLGHIKSNCVIACHSCNISRVGQKIN